MIYTPYVDGQLGNQLFHHAHLMSCAARFGVGFWSSGLRYWRDFPRSGFAYWSFAGPTRALRLSGWKKFIVGVGDTEHLREALEGRQNLILRLHDWLPPDLRQEHSPETSTSIRRRFSPHRRRREDAQSLIDSLRPGPVVGVHIRRGDFREYDGGRWLLPLSATVNAMRDVAAELSGASFVVCCDEQLSRAEFDGLPVTFGPGSAIGDMMALAHCDRILKPPRSTFASWASWWGEVPMQIVSEEGLGVPCVAPLDLQELSQVARQC